MDHLKKMDIFKIISLNIIKDKKFSIVYICFFLFFISYLFNPYSNNNSDFIVTSKYLLSFSCVFIFIWGIWGVYRFLPQLNYNIVSNYLTRRESIKGIFVVCLITLFVLSQILILSSLIIYYYFIFGFSIEMAHHIFNLYLNYLLLPMLISLIFSIYISMIFHKETPFKRILIYSSLLIFIFTLILFEKNTYYISDFYLFHKDFYNPFSGLKDYSLFLISQSLIFSLIFIYTILLIKYKNKKIMIHIQLLFFLFSIAWGTNNFISKKNLESHYMDDFIHNMKIANEPEKITPEKSYYIDSYLVELKAKTPVHFTVDVSITNVKNHEIKFYINETFKIKNIDVNEEHISFVQNKNVISLNLNTLKDQTLTFTYEGLGTAINPVNSDYLFLPYYFKWLPTNISTYDYIANSHSLDYHPFSNSCNKIQQIKSDFNELIIQKNSENTCVSLIKGDFISKKIANTTYYIPKAWSGGINNLKDYKVMRSDLINLYNKLFNQKKANILDSIIIMPRYEDSPPIGLNDIWTSGNNQIILMNPFLNVNDTSLYDYIYQVTLLSTPFSLIRDNLTKKNFEEAKLFSYLFTFHYLETSNQEENNKYILEIKSLLNNNLNEFSNLNKFEREKKLKSLYKTIISVEE